VDQPTHDQYKRLGAMIEADRMHRWRRREDFAAVTRLSVSTILSIERGQMITRNHATKAAIEDAIWAPGDFDKVLYGGWPTRERELQHVMNSWPKLSTQAKAMIVGMVDDALAGGE
jgi:hypothetical protein